MRIKYFSSQAELKQQEIDQNKTHSFYGQSFNPSVHGYNLRALGEGDVIKGLMRIKTEDEIRMLQNGIIENPLPRQDGYYIQGVEDEKVDDFVDKYPNATAAEAMAHFESGYKPPEDSKGTIPQSIRVELKN